MISASYQVFDQDVNRQTSYQYTSQERFSAVVSNARISAAVEKWLPKKTKTLIDVGCGDGTYTHQLQTSRPKLQITGFDPAARAIKRAQKYYPKIHFAVADLLRESQLRKLFPKPAEVAVVRGVIHHLPNPELGIKNTCLLARRIIVIEPNGHNPILKIIEKLSPYHREHQEQSYSSQQLEKWFVAAGAELQSQQFIGFVPFFCPEWFARVIYTFQPSLERIPGLARVFGAQVVQVYKVK